VIRSLSEHFFEYSKFLRDTYLSQGGKLIEMGCNDGVLLQYFKDDPEIFSIGIDPSENVTQLARDKWLHVINDFFSLQSAEKILEKFWKFDVLTGSNMFAHIDNIIDVIQAAKTILKDDGVFIFEVHYLVDLLREFQYDTIYHEHLTYYSITAIQNIFALQDMKIVEVQHLTMHGGGIRVVTANKNSYHTQDDSVAVFLDTEKDLRIDNLNTYMLLDARVKQHKKDIQEILLKVKSEGKSIVWYGAPGRGTILLNYCDIGEDIIDYIVDISPLRKWKLMPWVHIKIVDPSVARGNPPDYFLVLAWNYIDSLLEQEVVLREKWVKFILPFPEIRII
jgi:methylation protein EvaC